MGLTERGKVSHSYSVHYLTYSPLSLPTSVTDSIEGSGPASRESGETGVKMVQQANPALANQSCCSSTIHV